ncbi:Putative RING zinc finger domain superfamily protein [Zea mays]|uniref:Putative RING zinc finger domain superfamily protein n=1 Tax=Zea mays TaxID=4577 RepID=A0A1D6PII0_MAIZE|nr:Putative RING zinc finger domain superfamily protein [Zea mays]
MEDFCAVCADTMDWVAYGLCGHREVCSTCVARLRLVMDDKRCCICKTVCPSVFVTKAMGKYTRVVTDFSVFPNGANEGKAGDFWYHGDTQAYFDDADHYRMIRSMCQLSCNVCDNAEDQDALAAQAKRRSKFRNIDQLKGHLYHVHRLHMCNLCLEGRKVFICEQKLYLKSQLAQHMKTGDSEVDGSEVERNGFAGHPMCEFCRSSFYGDSELYMHTSREHYSCHICKRQNPGRVEYFANYEDIEKHNAMEHGGRMSRSQRNAALETPSSFIYRRNEQEQRRGRGGNAFHDRSNCHISSSANAFHDGFDCHISSSANAFHDRSDCHISSSANAFHDKSDCHIPSTAQKDRAAADGHAERLDNVSESFQSLSIGSSSREAEVGEGSRTGRVLEQLSFRPLSDPDIPDNSVETSSPSLSEQQSSLNQSARDAPRLGDESLFPPLTGSSNKMKQPVFTPKRPRTFPAAEDIHAAKMRYALGMNEDMYSAFKEIAGEYRRGTIDAFEYLSYVEQFGLSHLVPEMARLLPDSRKQRELADAHYTNTRLKNLQENGNNRKGGFFLSKKKSLQENGGGTSQWRWN